MKLLILLPSISRGGVEEHALKIGKAAVAMGWTVEAAFPNSTKTASLEEDFRTANCLYNPLSINESVVLQASSLTELIATSPTRIKTWLEQPIHFLRVLIYLIRSDPDVVMIGLPWGDKCFTSQLACALLSRPTLTFFHCIPWQLNLPNWKISLYHWSRSRSQIWATVSDNYRFFVSKSFQVPVDQIALIYNSIDLQSIKKLTAMDKAALRDQLRKNLDISKKSRVLVTVGRLDINKGYFDLIPTIPHLLKQFPDIHFVWLGDGDQRVQIEQELRDYNIHSSVSVLGYQKNIEQFLQAGDLFVFPTHFEGSSFALLEAMAYELPIVSTSTSSIPEIIEHRVDGLLARKADSCDLLETIRWALENPDEMAIMARNAKAKVFNFSQEKMLEKTIGIIKSLLSTGESKVL